MELYLSACSKTANAAASKAASSSVAEGSQQCGDGAHKTSIRGVGAAQLLDLPLGVKLPMIPGSDTVFFTTNISEKLFRPSYGFNLNDPYCRLLETQYKSLHDPHLRAYYKRKDILRRLKKGGYITSNNKIVCTLRELNKYRQYLTSLKLDFERNYLREQQMISKQLHKLQETCQVPHYSDVTQFQNWLLQDNVPSVKDQERLLRHRYLDMISKELEQLERTAEEQRLLQMDREERRQREYTRKKLSLRRKIEEEWKTKEMLLLTRIGEDVKREQRIEEQRRRSREESDRKKQALLEKKMAYHLQKMQDASFKEDAGKSAFEPRGQNGNHYEPYVKKKSKVHDDMKVVYPVIEPKTGQVANAVNYSQGSSKNVTKVSVSSVSYQQDIQNSNSEVKKNGVLTKKTSGDDKGSVNIPVQDAVISPQQSPTKIFPRYSRSSLGASKEEKEIHGDNNGKPGKRSSYTHDSDHQNIAPAPAIFSTPVQSNMQQNLQRCMQEKVTSEELNSIIQNIMTWVVATVTSILYPAITKYEERLQNNIYPVSEDSELSSESSSFCSTCSEGFTYKSYTSETTKTFQAEPCTYAVDASVKKPPTPLKPPSAHVERTVIGKTYHRKGQTITSQVKYDRASVVYPLPTLRSSKSDSNLLLSVDGSTKKSKDATTETDSLENTLLYDKKEKTMEEMKNLKNVLINFKCHLKGETQLILESIFHEIMSDLSQAIPCLSSVTAEVFVDQCETEKEDLLSNVDICSVASEIVENMLEKLESAVEKKCVEIFSQEDLSVDIKPSLSTSGEFFSSIARKSSENSLSYTLEPMRDIAEDMVHAILEKLMTLASYKKNELSLEDTKKHPQQPHKTDSALTLPRRNGKKSSSPKSEIESPVGKEEIQDIISNIFSQSSVVGYIEEAISTILGYVQTELNNERLIASEETIMLLRLLDDVLTQLHQKPETHQEPVKSNVKKIRKPRQRNASETEEKYRLTGTRLCSIPRTKRPFPPVNVPGMVLYSDDDDEEIENLVKTVLDSSVKDEKARSQEQTPSNWYTKGNSGFEFKKSNKPSTKPASHSKVHDWELKTELSPLNNEAILKKKLCLNKDISIFSQDQRRQIQKASENIVKHILTEILKDLSSVSPTQLGSKIGEEADFVSGVKGLSDQERMDQMFPGSEISSVAQEITDSVLNILHKASKYIPDTIKNAISSVHQTFLNHSDSPHTVKDTSNKAPFKVWFDSEKKMKYLSTLNVESEKSSCLRSGEGESKHVDNITAKIVDTIFKRLKLLVCPKLQRSFKSSLMKTSLQSQLSTYTMKIVNIVLHAIQNELGINKKNPHLRQAEHSRHLTNKGLFTDSDKNFDSLATNLGDDIMESPLLTCICEMLSSGTDDQSNTSVTSEKPMSATLWESDVNIPDNLPSGPDKKTFRQYLATPCVVHSAINGKERNENAKLKVLDQIGETLHELLGKITSDHADSLPTCRQENTEKTNKDHLMAAPLLSNVQFISKAILECILVKLCNVDKNTSFASSGFKTDSKSLDIDNLSFTAIIEEMSKCTNIISSIISRMMEDNKEMTKSKEKDTVTVSLDLESLNKAQPNKLKAVASDILHMVFGKLEGFANGNIGTLCDNNDDTKKENKVAQECESNISLSDSHDESLQSALYMHAKKVSNALLKAIQTELNTSSSDCSKNTENPPLETKMFMNIVDLILEMVSSDMFAKDESDNRGIESYRYRPTYGNFLPGGAESELFLDDETHKNEEFSRERTSQREEPKTHSSEQWILERTLNKIEVKLKEPHKSPIVPIIRNILNEIFQSALINQLNVLSLSHSHFSGMSHDVHESAAQTSVHFMDTMMSPLVSDTDVTIVVNDVVRTVFHKLYSAAMTEKSLSENRCETIIFSTNVSFHEHTRGENLPITVMNGNPGYLQSRWNVDKQTKLNVVEDIIQAILVNLESFAASKVESLFCPQADFTIPVTLPVAEEESTLNEGLTDKDSYSDEQCSCYSGAHDKTVRTDSLCQINLTKLNIYAKEVARKILQGIKHELDKERESPFLTHNIVVSEGIASQIVNTVLDIVSCKSKCDLNKSDKEKDSYQQEGIIEKLFNKTDYQRTLQFQIHDTIEGILSDIYEKILHQNLLLTTPTLNPSITGKRSEEKSEQILMDINMIQNVSVPKSDVILLSNDIVDIVLHNLTSLVLLAMNAKDSPSARLAFYDMLPKAQCPQPLLIESRSEEKTKFSHSENNKLAYTDNFQISVEEKEGTKGTDPNSCEENANFITETIFNRLQSFATQKIDSLITLAFQPKENTFVSPELENGKQDDSIFVDSSQIESRVNVLKISTTKTFLSQETEESTFSNYREKLGTSIHLSQASLKDYADVIASVILKLIKNDLDLEIKNMNIYPNNILFQRNIIVSEIVNNILMILYAKRPVKEMLFSSKKKPIFSQLTTPNETLLGHKEKEKNITQSQFPLEEKQITVGMESQKTVLEEVFMRKGESKQKEKTELLNAVEEVLNKLSKRIMEIIGHLPSFHEFPYLNSKIKILEVKQKNFIQSQIGNMSNDILENILEEIYSAVVTSLYKNKMSEVETSHNDASLMKQPCFRETKLARKTTNSLRYGTSQVDPYTDNLNTAVLENGLQYSPSQIGSYLVQLVLNKMSVFVSLHLEEKLTSEGSYDDLYLLRLHNSKASPKNSPKSVCKANLKARSKITSISKFKAKQHIGISGAKAKSKTKLGSGEKNLQESRSKTAIGLPQILSTGDAKTLLMAKLPISELKIYAKNIISDILEIIIKELGRVIQSRALVNIKALPSDEIMEASKIINEILQELYATDSHNLSYPVNISNLGHLSFSKHNLGSGSLTEKHAGFYLDNVSSQLEQIFPKEGIFKKMFDKWQTETSDTENEKFKLLTIAENLLTEISIKAKDLEYSLSLLNLPPLEDCENRLYAHIKCGSTRAEDTKAQITMFGREIVEMLFEKLQLFFLSQLPTQDSKESLANRKDSVAAKSKHNVPAKNFLSSLPTCNMKTNDQVSMDSSNLIVQEIVERILNMLESFVDLQFKHISKYEFSEIVKMPIENLFQVQQRQLSKKILPKLQPLKKCSDESKSSTIISKENIQNTLLQVHSFHSELLTYSVNTVSDMLVIIKSKLEKEIRQTEPSSVSILKENIAASDIIDTLINQCTHFNKSLITSLPKKNLFQSIENVYIVNQIELASQEKMPTSKLKEPSVRNNLPQRNVSGMVFYSEENMKEKFKMSSNSPSNMSSKVENAIRKSEIMGRPNSKTMPLFTVNKVQEYSTTKCNLGHFDGNTKGNSSLPEGSVLQKLFKKANESTEESLKEVMSFIEMGKGENPRVFHYEAPKPNKPIEIQTSASPLRICVAAENIVNTVLSGYGFAHQPCADGSMETMKPFFISKRNSWSEVYAEDKNKEKSLLRTWSKRSSYMPEEEIINLEACGGDCSLLQKWQNKDLKINTETFEEVEAITFLDHELGPNEIHLVARHVTTSVVTHLKNFKTLVSTEEKLSLISTLSRRKYELKQSLRFIYSNSSIYRFCEHLADSVICHLIANISDGSKEGTEKGTACNIQGGLANKIISIQSQMMKSRSISIGQLALSISEVIIEILFNGNIIKADTIQAMDSIKTTYIYCPKVTSSNLDDLFQDILKEVIFVLSKELGINPHFEKDRKNKPHSTFRSKTMPICSKTNDMESQIGPGDWEISTHQNDQLVQKKKLNYLAYKLDSLAGNLKTHESKEVIDKVFNIVSDLFLPDEFPDADMNPTKVARTFFSSSNNQQSNRILPSNLGLSPKSVFLLNIVCEKLIRTLLEKYTGTSFLDNSPFPREEAEVCQLLKILQSSQDADFDYCKSSMNCEQFQGDYMSDLLENLAEIDQDLVSSDCILNIISQSLVKSLMDKLSHGFQQAPFESKYLNHRAREIQSSSIKTKKTDLIESKQVKSPIGFINYDNNFLSSSLNNCIVGNFKIQGPFGKPCMVKSSSLSPPNRQELKGTNTIPFPNKSNQKIGVYSATFLEEIISELFFNLSSSLWRKNANITVAWLNEMNTLFINNLVSELNHAQITVLRDADERLFFPPVQKEIVSKIIDSIYCDVLQQYEFKVTCGGSLLYDSASIAEQVSSGILLEILDYQLPSCFKGKLRPNSCQHLDAEIILHKLQNKLKKFIFDSNASNGYSTMLPHSFLEDVIRRILVQLVPPPIKPSSLEKKYLMSSDFNEMSNCIINKVMSAISKHKIWLTIYDNQCLCTGKSIQKMVDSVYSNILQMSDSLVLVQKSIISRSPVMVDRIASFIIQVIIENHLHPFLYGESVPRPRTPVDTVSSMVKQVLSEVIESQKPLKPSHFDIHPDTFVGEIVARVLTKIFSPKTNADIALESMTQRIVNAVNQNLEKAKIHILCDKQQSFPIIDTDAIDELVTSVYRNVLKQHGLDPDIDKESQNSDNFVENITRLIVAAISDYLVHPLFSSDLSDSSCSNSVAESIVCDILSDISKSDNSSQSLPPYNTLLPYTFLEDMTRALVSRVFPPSTMVPNNEVTKDKSVTNFNEIASNLISDIRMKISQHEIRFSKDEEKAKCVYSEDDVQHLVDSVFTNVLDNSSTEESVEQEITKGSDTLVDKIAGYIIKYVCEQHLQPFLDGKQSSPLTCTYSDDDRQNLFCASVYSSAFLEDVVSGVLSKVFHRVVGIIQIKSARNSEDVLFQKAENLIHQIIEEFSKVQVTTIDNAEELLCLPPVARDVIRNIIDTVYSKVLEEYEMEILPDKDFLDDTKTLAARITKIILTEIFDFQIPPTLIGNMPLKSHSKLNENVLVNRVQYDISKSSFRRQASTIYTTMLSHVHLEKIVTQLMSQIDPLQYSVDYPGTAQSDLSHTVIQLINEIMSIISKHAICIIKHGSEKQSMISEKEIQSMVESIYADLSQSNVYQSLTKDKKGISSMPVSKIASFIIKEIFNHHLQSFLSGDKSFLSASIGQTGKQKATDTKQKELSFIVNSVVFLEEVISELLCKILHNFTHNALDTENPGSEKVKIADMVTTLVNAIVLEFTTSEILLADNLDENLLFSEAYKEMVQQTVHSTYESILEEYKSLIQVYWALQNDPTCFGGKIYHFLLEKIYDYQVKSLVSGELLPSCYSSPNADNIIKNVLSAIFKDSDASPSCITIFPCSLLENMISKLLVHIFPSKDTANEIKEENVTADDDDEFMTAASKLTDEIMKEISEHEIRLATQEENAETTQVETFENVVDSICNNILKKSEFQAEVKKGAHKKGGSFLSKVAGFIIKEIMDHHLQPFLYGEEPSSNKVPDSGHASAVAKPGKKVQPSVFSASFLEDVIVDIAHKFCSFSGITEDSRKKEMPEPDIISLTIKFANSLIGEFRKSEIKVLPHAEEIFSFPPIGKETVDEISNFVYGQFIGKFGSNDIQKGDKSNIVIEMISALAQKAMSAFKIQTLFSGDWSSTFFSFLNPENITQRVQLLPRKTSMQITRCLKQNQLILSEQKHASIGSDQKNKVDNLEIDKSVVSKEKSLKKDAIQDPILSTITTVMTLMSRLPADPISRNVEDENKVKAATPKYDKPLKATSPTSSIKKKETKGQNLSDTFKNNETEKGKLSPKREQEQVIEEQTRFSVATVDAKHGKEELKPDFETEHEKNIDGTGKRSLPRDDKLKISDKEKVQENTLTQKPSNESRRDFPVEKDDIYEEQFLENESVQNVIDNIYDNVLVLPSSQEPLHSAKLTRSKTFLSDKALVELDEIGSDSSQSVTTKNSLPSITTNDLSPFKTTKELSPPIKTKYITPSMNKNILIEEKEREKEKEVKKKGKEESKIKRENEKVKEKELKNKTDHPQYSADNKPGIIPAKFLEDVIIEMVNKLIFSSPETETHATSNTKDDQNQTELYDTAMKLIHSLLKEFSDAEIKVFRPDKGSEFSSQESKEPSTHTAPLRYEEVITNELSPNIRNKNMDKIPSTHKIAEKSSHDKIPPVDRMASIDKSLVNKIVHSCVCNILKENKSQESIRKNINTNGENLAKKLTSAVINEIFQHQLDLIFSDEVPASACMPLESKDVVKKVKKVVQTASKECQTSSPYTVMLPYKFLEDVISGLLLKIFSKISITTAKRAGENVFTELDFLQMKLVSTVAAEISKNEDMTIQYVESLHPNDDEIIQLVVQTIYNNLLPQFGSQETIQNCISSECRLLSQTIVDLVLREVGGNQLQNYFCGELTPRQCAEVDSVVENILKNVIQTTPPKPSRPRKLSSNIIEEIAVKFLSKLLSVFPKVHTERTKSRETEMQKITAKVVNSIQEFICKSKIKVVQPTKESETVPLADNAAEIEKVVDSVYTSILKHSGSHTSIFEDLMGRSNVLSDIIGCLMVKEISNSEFQPQIEEEVSSSELVLEAVKIMEKVIKIIDGLKSQEKSLSMKCSALDARVIEEALALFLAKLLPVPSADGEVEDSLTDPELNEIASELKKSVTTEISRSNISLVSSDAEERTLDSENMEIISQVIDSIYNNMMQQSGNQKDLYDMKVSKDTFPKNVASLIIDGVSSVPSYRISTKPSYADSTVDLDTNRIIERAQKHAANKTSEFNKELNEDVLKAEVPVKIIPHVGNKPIKIDPNIISQHLAVISIKTQPLEKLKTECMQRTGHSISELRRASISGKSYSSTDSLDLQKRQKERRTSLDRTGRLDVRPLEAVGRNSFQNIRKPDITRVELLKDIHSKKDLIIRLVAHDINKEDLESDIREETLSDEEEIVLGDTVGQPVLRGQSKDKAKEAVKPKESKVFSPKTTLSANSLRKFLALSKCCQTTTDVNVESIEEIPSQIIESRQSHVKKPAAEINMTSTQNLAKASSSSEKRSQYKKEECYADEPAHYFIHRIMSSSSYNQEDLISYSGEAEESKGDIKANAIAGSSQEQKTGNSSVIQLVSIFEDSKNLASSTPPTKEHIPETSKTSISKQGSKMLAKVSSTLSKVFSRSSGNVPKSSSPSHEDKL